MNTERIEQKDRYHEVVIFFLNATIFIDIFRVLILKFMPALSSSIELARNAVYIFCILYWLYQVFMDGVDETDSLLLIGITALLFFSYWKDPRIARYWTTDIIILYTRTFLAFVMLRHVSDFELLAQLQAKLWWVSVLYAALMPLQQELDSGSYQKASYNLIPLAVFFILYGYIKHHAFWGAIGIYEFIMAVSNGSRGAILFGVLALTIFFTADIKRNFTPEKLAAISFIFLVLIFVFFFWDELIAAMAELFPDSYFLKRLVKGELFNSSSRDESYTYILSELISNPLTLFRGLFQDRIFLASARGEPPSHYYYYPHNIILEVLFQYGVPIGTGLIFYVGNRIYRGLKFSFKKLRPETIFYLVYVVIGLGKLFVSSSYLIEWTFGAAMGMAFNRSIMRGESEQVEDSKHEIQHYHSSL